MIHCQIPPISVCVSARTRAAYLDNPGNSSSVLDRKEMKRVDRGVAIELLTSELLTSELLTSELLTSSEEHLCGVVSGYNCTPISSRWKRVISAPDLIASLQVMRVQDHPQP